MIPIASTVESRRAARLTAIAALCVYLLTAGGSLNSIDAVINFEATRSLVAHGTTAFERPGLDQHQGVDGRFYSPFGIGQSVFDVPFFVAAQVLERTMGLHVGRTDTLEKAGVALASTVSAAFTVGFVYLFAWQLSGDLDASLATALACGFGTLVWPYSKFGFNQGLTATCLIAGVYLAWVGVRNSQSKALAWSGVALACAFLTRHEMAVAAAVVALWVAFESRHDRRLLMSRLLWFGAPLAVALGFWLWYNHARFGHFFETGNLGAEADNEQYFRFSRATLVGVAGLLFSPGRSLFLYVPLMVAALPALAELAKRDRSLAGLFAGLFGAMLVLYGSLHYWDGLRGYGPRYLVPLLPMMTVPLVCWLAPFAAGWRRVVVGLMWLSVAVQLAGVVVDFSKVSVDHAAASGYYSRDAKIDNWGESALVLNAAAARTAVPANVANLVRGVRPPVPVRGNADDSAFAQRFSFSLDFWWLYLFYFGLLPAPVSAAVALVLVAAAVWLFSRIPRSAAAQPRARPSA